MLSDHLHRQQGIKGLLYVLMFVLIGFTVILGVTNQQNTAGQRHQSALYQRQAALSLAEQRLACLGAGQRTVDQLQLDYGIYASDAETARAKATTLSQRRIRGAEAKRILGSMEKIAANRVDALFAKQLPAVLARVVRAARFSCKATYAPGVTPPPIPANER